MKPSIALLLFVLLAAGAAVQPARGAEGSPLRNSIVTVEVTRKQYDYYQPWTRKSAQVLKTGTVVGERQILTTADGVWDRSLVRVQKEGRGQWWIGEVSWVDYYANLAMVTVSQAEFWRGLKPLKLAGATAPKSSLQIVRWRDGNLENRSAEFTQFKVREAQLVPISMVQLEISSEIQGVGWGEPILCDSRLAGIIRAQDGRTCIALPADFVSNIIEAHQKPGYRGLGYFHFYWQQGANPASLARLGLPGLPRGVIVDYVPPRPDTLAQTLQEQDIIISIDGFDLDIEGDYQDPAYGHLMLENLAVRGKWAGDEVKMKVWRDHKFLDLSYRLPRFEFTNALVPYASYDQPPQYYILGGLVFQPLTDAYLQSWGPDWKQRAPFRLNYYNYENPTKERPALVVLSQVLPDPYNIGYQEQHCLVLDKVNGQPISHLSDLREALCHPLNGYHLLEFAAGDTTRRMVLTAGDAEAQATARVLQRYSIAQSAFCQ